MVRAIPAGGYGPARETFRNRLPLAVAVLLLHLAALSIFEVRYNMAEPDRASEAIITFPAQQKKPAPAATTKAAARKSFGTFKPPPEWIEPKQDLSALHLAITSCAPEDIARLSQRDRARCNAMGLTSTGTIGPGTEFASKSNVKDPQKWAAELKARNTPAHVPCTYTEGLPVTGDPAIMVDVKCAAEMLLKSLK